MRRDHPLALRGTRASVQDLLAWPLALKRVVAAEKNFITLIGEFAASREIQAEELVTVSIDHPLFLGTKVRALVKSGRPLVAAPHEMLDWILQRMAMFGRA